MRHHGLPDERVPQARVGTLGNRSVRVSGGLPAYGAARAQVTRSSEQGSELMVVLCFSVPPPEEGGRSGGGG